MVRILSEKGRKIVIDYLERNHMESTFLIGNVIEFGLENNMEKRRCGDYYGYLKGERLRGILSFYNVGSCIL
ncbi:hypothetical protein [Fonticella tunisiensis]|uniref:Uncharacterized protein n=1 Tax=Fonticella tunisiensis TaxID=1096341 RepID=A0A4R7KU66_9CLOT|nr:hypothetical protein [Fonticella tunisiensis]TDT63603.1 hypothetical protein EDD71_10128 [Fonticella tunisiensis]